MEKIIFLLVVIVAAIAIIGVRFLGPALYQPFDIFLTEKIGLSRNVVSVLYSLIWLLGIILLVRLTLGKKKN